MKIGMDIKKIHFYLLKHFLRNILLRYLLLAVYLFLVTKGVMSYSSEKVIRNLLIISLILLILSTLCYKLIKRKVTTMYHLARDITAKDVDADTDWQLYCPLTRSEGEEYKKECQKKESAGIACETGICRE